LTITAINDDNGSGDDNRKFTGEDGRIRLPTISEKMVAIAEDDDGIMNEEEAEWKWSKY
jgi:hypothetical protein